jgi:dipeptidase E
MRTIFAMGGGGFTMEPDNTVLDEYILGLARRPVPRVCFLPTASGDPLDHITRFYEAFSDLPCEPTDLSLFRLGRRPVDLRALLHAQDIVYVGGGSMRNMLAIWRVHELDAILRECWTRGIVLAGLSAGAMCWFRAGITKSRGRAEPVAGLGLLEGSLSVHYDGEPERRPVYLDAVASGAVPEGFGADDGVGLLFRDARLERAVSSRPAAGCVRVKRAGDRAVEQPVHVDLIADREPLVAVDPDVRELRATRYRSSLRGGA